MISVTTRLLVAISLALTAEAAEARPARNVILLVGDAGGLSTLNAAGIYAHDRPQSLFIHSMPHIGLSDTSAVDEWVSDSAAGMTAIVTGEKTVNGALSVVPIGDRPHFRSAKTILEYAEERGLSTGIVTNMPFWDATPAACYAHASKRGDRAAIINQLFAPRFGNGPEIIVGKDPGALDNVVGRDARSALLDRHGYRFVAEPSEITSGMKRVISLSDSAFDPKEVVETAIGSLDRNRKGYFLMVEWDMHTNDLRRGLNHAIEMDGLIRHISQIAGKDTLILFVADHSYDLQLLSGSRGRPLADQLSDPDRRTIIHADTKGAHAGEEVVAAAMGPGAAGVRGFFPNTRLFTVMMEALGWKRDPKLASEASK